MTTPIKPCDADKTGWTWFRTFESDDNTVTVKVTPKFVDSLPNAIKDGICIEQNTINSGLSPYYYSNDVAAKLDLELTARAAKLSAPPIAAGQAGATNIYEIKAAYLNLPQEKVELYLKDPPPAMTTEEALGNLNEWLTVKAPVLPKTIAYIRAALSDDKNELFRADPVIVGKYYIMHDYETIAMVVAVMDDVEVNMRSRGASEKEVDEFLTKVSNPFGEVKDDTRSKYDEKLRKSDHIWTTITFVGLCPLAGILGGFVGQFLYKKGRKGGGGGSGGGGGGTPRAGGEKGSGGDVPATRPVSQRPARGWNPKTRFRFVRSEYPKPSSYRPFVPPKNEGLKQPLMMEFSALGIFTLSALPFTTLPRVAVNIRGFGAIMDTLAVVMETGWKWLVLGAEAGAGVL